MNNKYRNIILYLSDLKKALNQEDLKRKSDIVFYIEMIEENIKDNIKRDLEDLRYQTQHLIEDLSLYEKIEKKEN